MTQDAIPFGSTIFCDDIREEVSGKSTYVGVYQGNLFIDLQGQMALLPKLALVMTLSDPTKKHFKTLEISLFNTDQTLDDEPMVHNVVTPEHIAPPTPSHDLDKIPGSRNQYIFKSVISPFPIPKYGIVIVRAKWDDHDIHLGSLKISPTSEVPAS